MNADETLHNSTAPLTRATASLQESVEEDLKVEDPKPEVARAALVNKAKDETDANKDS